MFPLFHYPPNKHKYLVHTTHMHMNNSSQVYKTSTYAWNKLFRASMALLVIIIETTLCSLSKPIVQYGTQIDQHSCMLLHGGDKTNCFTSVEDQRLFGLRLKQDETGMILSPLFFRITPSQKIAPVFTSFPRNSHSNTIKNMTVNFHLCLYVQSNTPQVYMHVSCKLENNNTTKSIRSWTLLVCLRSSSKPKIDVIYGRGDSR